MKVRKLCNMSKEEAYSIITFACLQCATSSVVEQLTFNQWVPRSIRGWRTKCKNTSIITEKRRNRSPLSHLVTEAIVRGAIPLLSFLPFSSVRKPGNTNRCLTSGSCISVLIGGSRLIHTLFKADFPACLSFTTELKTPSVLIQLSHL